MKKTIHILTLNFDYFVISLCKALHVKEINMD